MSTKEICSVATNDTPATVPSRPTLMRSYAIRKPSTGIATTIPISTLDNLGADMNGPHIANAADA